jgi:hypothetical protein
VTKTDEIFRFLGLVGAAVMPFFNIPLMLRIFQRKSSADISLLWLFGVWGCIVLMFPSSVRSADPVLRVFGIGNVLLFSAVVAVVVYFRFRYRPTTPAA